MCNNGLKTFYPLSVMKITFFCYLLLITKSGFKTGNNWRTNMNPKRKIILSCILITLINITTLLVPIFPYQSNNAYLSICN